MMRVVVNCEKSETTYINAQVPSIWAKGRMLMSVRKIIIIIVI